MELAEFFTKLVKGNPGVALLELLGKGKLPNKETSERVGEDVVAPALNLWTGNKPLSEKLLRTGGAVAESAASIPATLMGYSGDAEAMILPASKLKTRGDIVQFMKEAQDMTPKEAFEKFGIYLGLGDKKLKSYLSDKNAKLDMSKFENILDDRPDAIKYIKKADKKSAFGEWSLPDILDHPELYKAMPELRKVGIMVDKEPNYGGAYYMPGADTIVVGGDDKLDRLLATILHETQHAVQTKSKFAKGGNSDMFLPDPEQFHREYARASIEQKSRRLEIEKKDPDLLQRLDRGSITAEDKKLPEVVEYSKYNDAVKRFREVEKETFQKYKNIFGEAESRAVEQMLRNEHRRGRVGPAMDLMPENRLLEIARSWMGGHKLEATPDESNFPLDYYYDVDIKDLIQAPK